jgi:hypothetical protein
MTEAAAERERRYREILGMDEPKPAADGAADDQLVMSALVLERQWRTRDEVRRLTPAPRHRPRCARSGSHDRFEARLPADRVIGSLRERLRRLLSDALWRRRMRAQCPEARGG